MKTFGFKRLLFRGRNYFLALNCARYLISLIFLVFAQACGGSSTSDFQPVDSPTPHPQSIIFADDFESDQPLSARYFEYSDAQESFVRTAGVGLGGSHAMRASWKAGQADAGSLKLAFGKVPAGLGYASQINPEENFREIYWRFYLKNELNWSGLPYKLSRAISFGSETSWAEAMVAHVWSSNSRPVLVLDPVSGINKQNKLATAAYNDFNNFNWLGAKTGNTPIFSSANSGKWFCIEAHVKLNTPGAQDGVFELWIDQQLETSISGLNWLGSWENYGLNAIFIENYWNDGAPGERVRVIDNLVVATTRIGCL